MANPAQVLSAPDWSSNRASRATRLAVGNRQVLDLFRECLPASSQCPRTRTDGPRSRRPRAASLPPTLDASRTSLRYAA